MNEVLQKLFLVIIIIPSILSGCASTPTSSPKSSYAIADNRIEFPEYKYSIMKPPKQYLMVEEPVQDEPLVWLDKATGTFIFVVASKRELPLFYQDIVKTIAEFFCDFFDPIKPFDSCEIVEEKEIQFNKRSFYQAVIIVDKLDVMRILLYLHRTDDFVYFFVFNIFGDNANQKQLINEIMQSVVFLGKEQKKPFTPKGAPHLTLIDAAYNGYTESVRYLLNAGADINAKDEDGVTALSYAADRGHMDIVKILLANNADVNSKSKIGCTPLINAAYMGHVEIVEALIANGADVNAQSKEGITALMNAAAFGYKEIAEMLLTSGADVNASDKKGLSALWNAISDGHADIVEVLIKNRADVNVRANEGSTALMNAAHTGDIDIVKMLLAAGADVNAKNNYGWNALMVAINRGHKEIIKLLRHAGAKEEVPTGPLDISMIN